MTDQDRMSELVDTVDGIEIRRRVLPTSPGDGGGVYTISTPAIEAGNMEGILVADPTALRSVADKIERDQNLSHDSPSTSATSDSRAAGD